MEDELKASAQYFQQMLIDDKISTIQMVQILIANLGDANVELILGSLMEKAYGNIDLSKKN